MFQPDRRIVEPEVMDQPGLAPDRHHQALDGLKRVNRLSGTTRILWRPIARLAANDTNRPLRLLDLACGGGDVAVALAKTARRSGVALTIHGWDRSATAVEHARHTAAAAGVDQVEFLVRDALSDPIGESYDVVMCSLFLHHLSNDDGRRLVQKMSASAGRLLLIDDLLRTRWGYALAWVGCRVLSRSSVVHTDGPMSVQAAYHLREVYRLAEDAGLQDAVISRHWPQRFLLSWTQPCPTTSASTRAPAPAD